MRATFLLAGRRHPAIISFLIKRKEKEVWGRKYALTRSNPRAYMKIYSFLLLCSVVAKHCTNGILATAPHHISHQCHSEVGVSNLVQSSVSLQDWVAATAIGQYTCICFIKQQKVCTGESELIFCHHKHWFLMGVLIAERNLVLMESISSSSTTCQIVHPQMLKVRGDL